MPTWTIRPIVTGYANSDRKTYLYHHSTHSYYNVEGKVLLPTLAFLAESEKQLILVDTGMSWTDRASTVHHSGSYQPEGAAIHERLASLGIRCEEISLVIFTHLHWDHVFYMEKFVHARFIAQRKEHEFALNPIPLYYKSYEHPVLGVRRPFEGIRIDLVDGEQEITPGLRVFPSPGHSPGHQSVEIDTVEGTYICCGDSIFIYDNLTPIPEIHYTITPPARYANVLETWKSIEELKARAKGKDFILPAHAPELQTRQPTKAVLATLG